MLPHPLPHTVATPSRPARLLVLSPVAAPTEIEWHRLSPRGREILQQIALRLAAGYSYEEIADILDRDRPPFRHLEPPVGGKPISKNWVSSRARELKRECEDMSVPV